MAQATTPTIVVSRNRSHRDLDHADFLHNATKEMSKILSAGNLSVWVTLNGSSAAIGTPTRDHNAPELIFESEAVFRRLVHRMRLFDFSMAYLDGKMKIVGPIARVIQIFDALNRATDRPQSVGEYLRLGLFRIGKALFPNKVLTFESIDHYAQNASAYKFVLG